MALHSVIDNTSPSHLTDLHVTLPIHGSPTTPLFLPSSPTPPLHVTAPIAAVPNTSPVFALTDAIQGLSEVVTKLWEEFTEVRKGAESLRVELAEV